MSALQQDAFVRAGRAIPSECRASLANRRVDAPHSILDRWLCANGEHAEIPMESLNHSWRSRMLWWCDPRQWLRAILQLKDSPHSIALGTAIGVFIGLTPTFGIQMVLVLAIACLVRPVLRFNQIAALVAVYVSNPFTAVPIYWLNYRVGAVFMNSTISWEEFVKLFEYDGFAEWWACMVNVFYTIGSPLIIGSLIVATFCALPTYPLMLRLLERVHARRELRRQLLAAGEAKMPTGETRTPSSVS